MEPPYDIQRIEDVFERYKINSKFSNEISANLKRWPMLQSTRAKSHNFLGKFSYFNNPIIEELRKKIEEFYSSILCENFRQSIAFNPNDLLDPRICKGDNFVPNILRALDVNEDICRNPRAIKIIEPIVFCIARQNNLRVPNHFEQLTREQIEAIVNTVKLSSALGRHYGEDSTSYKLDINHETGEIKIEIVHTEGTYNDYNIKTQFSVDKNQNLVADTLTSTKKDTRQERNVYNPDGIQIESEILKRKYDNNGVIYHKVVKRDEQYPFIAKESVLESSFGGEIGERYTVIDMDNLQDLNSENNEKDKVKYTTEFRDRSEIEAFYDENHCSITDAFSKNSKEQPFYPGLIKLAENAGIIERENVS